MQKKHLYLWWLIASLTTACFAQAPGVQIVSSGEIATLESTLHAEADSSTKPATRQLANYPGFYTALIYRNSTGEVEIHSGFDEIMIVIAGSGTVRTGGKAKDQRLISPGELRSPSAEGASATVLTKDTVVHIPAGTPHQVLLPKRGFVSYLDVKIAHVSENAGPK